MLSWTDSNVDQNINESLAESLMISSLEAKLLLARKIENIEDARRYLSPSFDDLHDPFLFGEMEGAVSAIGEAVAGGHRILVHGDYDVDGICGATLLYEALAGLGADVHYFIPDRSKDGYGLAGRVMKRGVKVGLKLVISVDCGSSDGETISYLSSHGVETVITDHHEIDRRPADAGSFINPKLPGEKYPFYELAGVGVAFKLLQALEKSMGGSFDLEGMLDLVALGTLGDYVDLVGENRTLVSLGLERLRRWERPGLAALRDEAGLVKDGFTARQLCFSIVPRLNSPGRMGSARDVVKLLSTRDADLSSKIAREIEMKNRSRREHDSRVTEEACYLADVILKRSDPNALVFSSSSWHEGVVGIGASRLSEKYNLPAVLIAVRDGIGKGSARSAGKVNIKETLEKCAGYLDAYGGHKEAGGFSIKEINISDFNSRFDEVVGELLEKSGEADPVVYDAEISLEQCDMELISFIERMAPFGPGNREPVFLLSGLEVMPDSRIVGKDHLRITVRDRNGGIQNLIGFTLGRAWNPVDIVGQKLDLLVQLRKNVYHGKVEPQVQALMIRISNGVASN